MPTLTEVRDIADAWLAARWPTVQTRQETYASNHNGRYWQGLRSHSSIPIDAIDSFADLLDSHPTDQVSSWNDALPGLPTNWPVLFVMDVYDGPQGMGYVGSVYVYHTNTDRTYSRSRNEGPETWRTVAWHQV